MTTLKNINLFVVNEICDEQEITIQTATKPVLFSLNTINEIKLHNYNYRKAYILSFVIIIIELDLNFMQVRSGNRGIGIIFKKHPKFY